MNFKKTVSVIMAIVLSLSCMFITANADDSINENIYTNNAVTILFEDGASDIVKEKIISDFTGSADSHAETRGLTCTLFGHKIETGRAAIITHEAKATKPRCLENVYDYEVCTRCENYAEYTLVSSRYIYCCS